MFTLDIVPFVIAIFLDLISPFSPFTKRIMENLEGTLRYENADAYLIEIIKDWVTYVSDSSLVFTSICVSIATVLVLPIFRASFVLDLTALRLGLYAVPYFYLLLTETMLCSLLAYTYFRLPKTSPFVFAVGKLKWGYGWTALASLGMDILIVVSILVYQA